jgi:RHS repeat-associated protein
MFTGRRYDDEAGLYYYRARYYKPEIGRFLSADPIGYEDGLNLYTYVHNNPVNSIDPEGTKEPISCLLCIGCLSSFGFSCAILCAQDPCWDDVRDDFWDCANKCWLSIYKANKWIAGICGVSCYACVGSKGGLIKK